MAAPYWPMSWTSRRPCASAPSLRTSRSPFFLTLRRLSRPWSMDSLGIFRAAGWPAWLLRYLEVLYHNNSCKIALAGAFFDGFVATRGIRQGCPLSPLFLAASSDLLLDRIGRLCGAFRRAYADDTALILKDGLASAGALADVFCSLRGSRA